MEKLLDPFMILQEEKRFKNQRDEHVLATAVLWDA
jgi:hypothetical protein